jgi:hypothetical protein
MLTPAYFLLDVARRQVGRLIDAAGLGSGEAPFRVVATIPGHGCGPTNRPATQPARCC